MKTLRVIAILAAASSATAAIAAGTLPESQLSVLDRVGRRLAGNPCAQPTLVRTKTRPNPHDPTIRDQIRLTKCKGWSAEVYRAHSYKPPVELPLVVRVQTAHPAIPPQFGVGASISRVRGELGNPTSKRAGAITYPLSEERPDQDTISFISEHGKVQSIVWSWAVD